MTEENLANPAEVAAPESEIVATPESAETEVLQTQETEKTPKTFTQEELDAIIGREKAKERRKLEREYASKAVQPQLPKAPEGQLSPDQFETYEAYADALANQRAHELVRQQETYRQQFALNSAYEDRAEEARTKYDDFDQVVRNPNLKITNEMAETIKASEIGPEVAYWLGTNPKEADRISQLSPLQQAREIGKIEVKLTAEPPVKNTSSAPEPITPVTARNASNPSYDTTDPRSIKSMSTSEWIEAERERQRKKAQQR